MRRLLPALLLLSLTSCAAYDTRRACAAANGVGSGGLSEQLSQMYDPGEIARVDAYKACVRAQGVFQL